MSTPERWFSIRNAIQQSRCDVCGLQNAVSVGVVERAQQNATKDVATLVLCRNHVAILTERLLGSALRRLAALPMPPRGDDHA